MHFWHVSCFNRKGQLKIQEMAFVLVAIIVFFAIVALFYINIRVHNLREDVSLQRSEEAGELVKKLATTAEFEWTASSCSNCIDLDKAMILKEKAMNKSGGYYGFWNLDYLKIEVVYPEKSGECEYGIYPDCQSITIIKKTKLIGTPESAFVALCRQEFKGGGYAKCELGKIYASGEKLK